MELRGTMLASFPRRTLPLAFHQVPIHGKATDGEHPEAAISVLEPTPLSTVDM